jgi:cytoskeletal protein CcmA (bactofilin family)
MMPDTQEIPLLPNATASLPETKATVIEEGTELKGTMNSSCAVLVRGHLEGELHAPMLAIAPSGAVEGKAKATRIESAGRLKGEFEAESVLLAGTIGDETLIRAKTLEVKLPSDGKMAAQFGECRLEVGEAPAPQL